MGSQLKRHVNVLMTIATPANPGARSLRSRCIQDPVYSAFTGPWLTMV